MGIYKFIDLTILNLFLSKAFSELGDLLYVCVAEYIVQN